MLSHGALTRFASRPAEREATYNKIVDFYTDKPYTSPIDRAGEMAAQSSW